MKTKQMMMLTVLFLGVLLGHQAQAFYNPSTGRWLSRDPLEEQGGVNLYCLARNNAIDGFDINGREDYSGTLAIIPLSPGQSTGGCGDGVSLIDFYVFGRVNGWVVQHVTVEADVQDCCGKSVQPKNPPYNYSEAWKVVNGAVLLGDGRPFRGTDSFTSVSEGKGKKGTIRIHGKVKFLKDYNLTYPPWSREGYPTTQNPSGVLPNINGTPPGWTDDGAQDHILAIAFNCCGSPANPTVTTVP